MTRQYDNKWVRDHEERNKQRLSIFPIFCSALWSKLSNISNPNPEHIKGLACLLAGISGENNAHVASIILSEVRASKSQTLAGRSQHPDSQAYTRFTAYLSALQLSVDHMKTVTMGEGLSCRAIFPPVTESPEYNNHQLDRLDTFIASSNFTGAVAILQPDNKEERLVELSSDKTHAQKFYNIASVGKVFTGILPLKLVADKVLDEKDLKKTGVKISESVLNQFPVESREAIRQRLSQVSLHQLMTHQAGFGDYLGSDKDGYMGDILARLKAGGNAPVITDYNQLLHYATADINTLSPINEFRYSNVGMLLTAAAVEQLVNERTGQTLTYNQILQTHLLNHAGISLQHTPPKEACFDREDLSSDKVFGGPAGGYWIKAEDLAEFGCYVNQELYQPSETMRRLFREYGQEFFNAEREEISHRGDTPTASAMFTVSMRTGNTFVALSDQGRGAAANLHGVCLERLEKDKQSVEQRHAVSSALKM